MSGNGANVALRRTQLGVVTQLQIRGALSGDLLRQLQQEVDACIDQHKIKILLDLNNVPLLDSKSLEQLLNTQDALMQQGGWLRLSNANALVSEVLRLTRVDEYIQTLDADGTSERATVPAGSRRQRRRLGDILVERELMSKQQVGEAMRLQDTLGKRFGQIVVDRGLVSEEDLLKTLAEQLELEYVRLRPGLYDPEIAGLLEPSVARRLKVLPLFAVRQGLFLATADPQALPVLEEVQERTGMRVHPVLAPREEILKGVSDGGGLDEHTAGLIGDVDGDLEVVDSSLPDDYAAIDEVAAGSPVVNLVNSIIQRAVRDGASDIHIEPFRTLSRIRFRIDGVLYEYSTLRPELQPALASRLKVMANLDIAERRMPQDGRIQVHTHGRSVDLRFSSLPGLFGEKIVLRLLDKNNVVLDVDRLGMHDDTRAGFKQLLGRTHGLLLVTGPTGSGKTTTLYAAMSMLNSLERCLVTIEDPVEYQIDIINQNEVRANIGLSFAKVLKHVLRQDPDVVMVGEIRERETAEIAVQAALTGHLVLSTLHTNDSLGAITRLLDMGIEPYLLSSALIGVVAQRLVRTVCPECKTSFRVNPELACRHGWDPTAHILLARGRGCEQCYDSGYKGRMGIHELIQVDAPLQDIIMRSPTRDMLADYLSTNKVRTLRTDGMSRVLEQHTTLEELARVTTI